MKVMILFFKAEQYNLFGEKVHVAGHVRGGQFVAPYQATRKKRLQGAAPDEDLFSLADQQEAEQKAREDTARKERELATDAKREPGTHDKTWLNVPFAEKDTAKKNGAKWDSDKKKWYVIGKVSPKLAKYQSGDQNSPSPTRKNSTLKGGILTSEVLSLQSEIEDMSVPSGYYEKGIGDVKRKKIMDQYLSDLKEKIVARTLEEFKAIMALKDGDTMPDGRTMMDKRRDRYGQEMNTNIANLRSMNAGLVRSNWVSRSALFDDMLM